jgi:hypothetical protein
MTVSSSQVQNVKLGSCNVSYGGTDLGLTKGGVNVTMSTQTKAITVDQFGQTIMNDYIMGRGCMVKVPMAETDLAKLAAVIPGATLVTDKTVLTKKKIVITNGVGTSLLSIALPLILHPTANAAGVLGEDFTAPLAAMSGNLTFDYQAENERIYQVEFVVYSDPATGLLYTIGDPSASAT